MRKFLTKYLPKIAAIVVASGLWLYFQQAKFVTVVINIPVRYKNKPDDLRYKEYPKRFVKLTVQGRGDAVKFPTSGLNAEVDLSLATPENTKYPLVFDRRQLPDRVDIVELENEVIVSLDQSQRKSITITPNINGNVASGFYLVKAVVTPSTVRVDGAASRVSDITQIATKSINIEGENKTLVKTVALIAPKETTLYPSQVNVRVIISEEKVINEISISGVPLVSQNLDPALKVLYSEKSVKIQVQGDSKLLSSLKANNFQAIVNLEGTRYNPKTGNILPFDTETLPVKIIPSKAIAKQIEILDVVPNSMTVRFEVKEKFNINPPNPENKPNEEGK